MSAKDLITRVRPLVILIFAAVVAQTATFTYQGRLTDGGTGKWIYDLQFVLFDCAGQAARR